MRYLKGQLTVLRIALLARVSRDKFLPEPVPLVADVRFAAT